MSTSVGQHRWDGEDRKHERQDSGGMDMYGGKLMGIFIVIIIIIAIIIRIIIIIIIIYI